ncbi:Stromal membrane-associated protein, putative [Perkinsus marinus ATCC 50983]|uniref:Stromal membrane-associated protein, putative n=1 Tax=Perkinsus marinus (strain ATCC 50983 / TXsc) TaxID=423536 RepID=C5L0X6_PERM5|nr:Stromal membrane-associated protein, putative [Perkinsus marinus ATCC 50983]EER09618.1 Stromal membrane-associated protein, putative [Perkinsus marinus ATCC 50983]|eukprot:XP_002777823.1 Stromal membrane-associated protein, putative [Perkinsus marinus ATCC 50983]
MIRTRLGNPQTILVDRIKAFQKSDKANRHCADCGELGPTYICTDFGTFVCTECAGIHRELTHKVKGISVSKWTQQEVEHLEAHGNTRDREIYMANYRPGIDLAEPNNQDRQRLREFMKLKYVDKRWAASQSDRAVRATVVDRTTGSRQGSVTASHTSQPDLIDTTTAVDNAERSSMKTKHHKPRKNSTPKAEPAATSGDLLDDDWGFQSAGSSAAQQTGSSKHGAPDELLMQTTSTMPVMQQPSPVTQVYQAATTTFDGDLGASIRMQCTSLLNSLRQLHTVDPAKSETAKRFIEDSLRGLGIEWMSGSYSSAPLPTASTASVYGAVGYPVSSNPSVASTGHIRSNSNPFDAMESTSRAMPPQVSVPRTGSIDRKDNNPFGEIAAWPQSSLRGKSAGATVGIDGITPRMNVPPSAQQPISPGGMSNLLGGLSPASTFQPSYSNGLPVNSQQTREEPFVWQ